MRGKPKLQTITVLAENKPGVLNRMFTMLRRRNYNIETVTAGHTHISDISKITLTFNGTQEETEQLVKQLYKILEITKVSQCEDDKIVARELALLKIHASAALERTRVTELAEVFRARIVSVTATNLILEVTGSEVKIDSFFNLLKPFGVQELVRTGRTVLGRDGGKKRVLKKKEKHLRDLSYFVKAVSAKAENLELSAIKKIEYLGRSYKNVVSLAQGTPSFQTPVHIKKAAIEAIEKNLVDKYVSPAGILPLRQAISKKLKNKNKVQVDPEKEIIVTHGATEALAATFLTLLDRDDEVIIPTPDYASHITQILLAKHGGRPTFVPLVEEKSWKLNIKAIENAITPKTKAILLCNPLNPTGTIFDRQQLKQIAKLAVTYNLFVITDEMYESFVYNGKRHFSIASLPNMKKRTISIFGVSKSYAMTGWRIGYLVTNATLAQQIFKVHDVLTTCPTVVSQYAALAAITGPQKCVREFKNAFIKRRNLVMKRLQKIPLFSGVKPEAAYYAFLKIEKENVDSYDFALQVLREAKVAVVPGAAFGPNGEGHVRISFACEEEKINKAFDRLEKWAKKYQ